VAGRLDAEHPDVRIVEERVEQADGVAAAADRRDQQVGQAADAASICARASVPITLWKSRTSSG
jgi:hypothetical protein